MVLWGGIPAKKDALVLGHHIEIPMDDGVASLALASPSILQAAADSTARMGCESQSRQKTEALDGLKAPHQYFACEQRPICRTSNLVTFFIALLYEGPECSIGHGTRRLLRSG